VRMPVCLRARWCLSIYVPVLAACVLLFSVMCSRWLNHATPVAHHTCAHTPTRARVSVFIEYRHIVLCISMYISMCLRVNTDTY
jgi:hypothetical protein